MAVSGFQIVKAVAANRSNAMMRIDTDSLVRRTLAVASVCANVGRVGPWEGPGS